MDTNKIIMLKKVLNLFALLWIVSAIGLCLGQFVPPALILPLIIIELILVVMVVFVRKLKVSRILAFLFALISGITIYPAISHYVNELGGQLVLVTFISVALVFSIYGLIGFRLNTNLSGWGSYLFIALIGLVVVSLVNLIFPLGETWMILVSMFGVLLFSLYTIYDFNRLRHQNFSDEDVPSLALNLYLDFMNLFLDVLRILNFFR